MNFDITNIRIIFVLKLMLFEMPKFQLSPEEADLIEAIRNLRKSYPNGYDEQLYYIQQLLDDMVDLPKD